MKNAIKNNAEFRSLIVFVGLLIPCYLVGYWLIFRLERSSPLMMSVGVAATLACLLLKRPLSSMGWQWGSWGVNWLNYLLPIAISLIAYLIIWAFGFGDFYNADFVESLKDDYNLAGWNGLSIVAFHLLISATFSFVFSIPSIVGEEMGWRGFLVPALSKLTSFTNVALVSGLLWALFHWPLMFRGIYGLPGIPLSFQLCSFSVGIVAASFIMTYYRYRTGSLWPAVMFHAANNIYIQAIFTPLTIQNESSGWYIDEFGAIPTLVTVVVAIYFWRKGAREFAQA